ncbi:CpaF family protein, partial [bacterium]
MSGATTTTWVDALHEELVRRMDLRRNAIEQLDEQSFRKQARAQLRALIASNPLPSHVDADEVERRVLQDCVGLGVLEDLLADDTVSEIMVNGPERLFVERAGRLVALDRHFANESALRAVIERLLNPTGRRVDEASPMADARLADGSRLNVVIPPLAVRGTSLTIRRFGRRRLGLTDLLASGALSPSMASLLHDAARRRLNVVISGGT